MGKYIVELKKNETLYKAATRESDGTAYVCSAIGTPYTAPDIEQVRKEGYEKGWKEAEDNYFDGYSNGYDAGLDDAWKAAKKIWEYDTTTLKEIFGEGVMRMDWFMKFTASEAIEKIWQYEQEKEMDGLRQNIQTIVDQCGYTLDEIASVLQKMRES